MFKGIVRLDRVSCDEELWGGKAYYLSMLKANGFNVPDAIVLSSKHYEDYINAIDNSKELNAELLRIISEMFGNKPVIFRSSANIENSERMSSSGVFESFIYNHENTPYYYLEKVWKSTLDNIALNYYTLTGISKEEVKMGVVIQKYIQGQVAAVVQSYDMINEVPITIIEYAFGSTSDIVDGLIDAECISVDRDGKIIDKTKDFPFSMDVILELNNSMKSLEELLKSHVEVEVQICDDVIYYLQVRKVV